MAAQAKLKFHPSLLWSRPELRRLEMRKGVVSDGEGGGGGLGEGMELATAVRWYFFFSTQLPPVAACSVRGSVDRETQ